MKNKSLMIKTLFALFFTSILLSSCEKDQTDEKVRTEVPPPVLQLSEEDILLKDKLKSVALIVSHTVENVNDAAEVKSGVEANMYYGLDEELRFMDLLSPENSKILKSSHVIKNFGNKMRAAFKASRLKSANIAGDDLETFVLNDNVQIYWPYSEYWDGEELPTITFDPLLPVETNIGFRKVFSDDGSYTIDTVIVDEEYSMNNPLWIINQNEIDYDDLPSFVDNEFTAGNVTFLQSNPATKSAIAVNYNNPNMIYEVQIGKVMCNVQYDFLWNGGSDIYFRMIGSRQVGTNSAIADYMESHYLLARFRRREIRHDIWREFFTPINPNWSPGELENGFIVLERDGGDEVRTFKGKLDLVGIIGVDFEFKYGRRDTRIFSTIWERIIFFAGNRGVGDPNVTLRGGFRVYKAGGVHWTMPYVIRPKPI